MVYEKAIVNNGHPLMEMESGLRNAIVTVNIRDEAPDLSSSETSHVIGDDTNFNTTHGDDVSALEILESEKAIPGVKVLYLQGKERDSEILIQDSIGILEEGGQGETMLCMRRLRHLAQMYSKSNRLTEAENVHRKILHVLEISKGWNSLDTVIAAEGLAMTLCLAGSLLEAQELLERCLEARKNLLSEDHIQIGGNILHIARVAMLNSNHLRKIDTSKAISELDRAKDLLQNSTRIATNILSSSTNKKNKYRQAVQYQKDEHVALVILLESLDALGVLEIAKHELKKSTDHLPFVEAENAFRKCITSFKEFQQQKPSISESPEVKVEYLSCLRRLSNLIGDGTHKPAGGTNMQELKDEIKHVEAQVSQHKNHKS